MKRMKNRMAALLSAAILMVLLTPTVQATTSKYQTKVTANCVMPEMAINVVVPTGTKAYLNPKQLPVKIGSTIVAAMIFSDEAYIENRSKVPVKVSTSLKGTIKSGSNLTLATASFATDETKVKKAFMYFEIQAVNDPENVTWAEEYDAEKHVVVAKTQKINKDIISLAAYDAEAEEGGEAAKRFGAFRLGGVCTDFPTSPWTSKDGVNVEIVFTFTALPLTTIIE